MSEHGEVVAGDQGANDTFAEPSVPRLIGRPRNPPPRPHGLAVVAQFVGRVRLLSNPLPLLARPISTIDPASRTPAVGAINKASVRLNIVAAAPIPSASETIDVRVNTGLRPSKRTE